MNDDMKDEIESSLRRIGGSKLVTQWHREYDLTPVNRLPTAYLDKFSLGYAIALGAIAASIDLVMDQIFRNEMAETYRLLDKKEREKLELAIKEKIKQLGLFPNKEEIQRQIKEASGIDVDIRSIPDSAMDCYSWLNQRLGLDLPLFPSNHRILNHADASEVIKMLMNGEAGIGNLLLKLYPGMSEGAARELYNLHITADRHTSRSVPLKIMSWLWEQCIRSKNPETVGAPSFLFDLLQKHAPNIDWKRWIEAFFGEDGIRAFLGTDGSWPENLSVGDVMLKLYEKGLLNERVFWTSDLGAAVGGFKRRIVIAATMEVGVEVFALAEGLSSGFVSWNGGTRQFASAYVEWRDQPKYLNMRTLAQATAAAGPAVRALWTGDAFSQNIPSLAMTMRHLWVSSDVRRRHMERLITFSQRDSNKAIFEFECLTGVSVRPPLALTEGGKLVEDGFEERLEAAGCFSTRVSVLASSHPQEMKPLINRIEALAQIAEGSSQKMLAMSVICETWYLSDVVDDDEAIRILRQDIRELEIKFGL